MVRRNLNSSMVSIRWRFSDDDYEDMPIYLPDVSSPLIRSITEREALGAEIDGAYEKSSQLDQKKEKTARMKKMTKQK